MKKTLSLIMAVIMLFSIIVPTSVSSFADTKKTISLNESVQTKQNKSLSFTPDSTGSYLFRLSNYDLSNDYYSVYNIIVETEYGYDYDYVYADRSYQTEAGNDYYSIFKNLSAGKTYTIDFSNESQCVFEITKIGGNVLKEGQKYNLNNYMDLYSFTPSQSGIYDVETFYSANTDEETLWGKYPLLEVTCNEYDEDWISSEDEYTTVLNTQTVAGTQKTNYVGIYTYSLEAGKTYNFVLGQSEIENLSFSLFKDRSKNIINSVYFDYPYELSIGSGFPDESIIKVEEVENIFYDYIDSSSIRISNLKLHKVTDNGDYDNWDQLPTSTELVVNGNYIATFVVETNENYYAYNPYFSVDYYKRLDNNKFLCGFYIYASSYETSDGLKYRINTDGKTASVSGYNYLKESNDKTVKYSIPETISLSGEKYTVTGIDDYAFCNSYASSITLPKTVTSIAYYSIAYANKLTSFTVPKGVKSINANAFVGSGIKTFKADSANKSFSASNGVLYSKDKSTLVSFPCGSSAKSFTVPKSVKTIGDSSFKRSKLTSLTVPSSVKKIGTEAFAMSSIKNVSLPNSITTIPFGAFNDGEINQILIPNSVKTIDSKAFSFSGINRLVFAKGSKISKINTNYFSCKTLTVCYYPSDKSVPNAFKKAIKDKKINCAVKYVPIKATNVSKSKVSVPDVVYTGKGVSANPKVVLGGYELIKGVDYTISSYKNNKKIGIAKLTIKGKGNFKGTITKSFKIVPNSTAISKLEAGTKAFASAWKKQATQTNGYVLQYSTDKAFKKAVKTLVIKSNKTTSKTIKSLSSGKTYYVRIRTYKTIGKSTYYSAWSPAKAVSVK